MERGGFSFTKPSYVSRSSSSPLLAAVDLLQLLLPDSYRSSAAYSRSPLRLRLTLLKVSKSGLSVSNV
eukprot:15609551-Heterocapsa_arctica.AAC.1